MKKGILSILMLLAATCVLAQADGGQNIEPMKKRPGFEHVITASMSPGCVNTEVQMGPFIYYNKIGFGYELSYRCVFPIGLGVGITHAQNWTTYSWEQMQMKHNMGQTSYVLAVLYCWHPNDRLSLWCDAGLGFGFRDGEKESGFVKKTSTGVEYKFLPHFGIGVDIELLSVEFNNAEEKKYDKKLVFQTLDKASNRFAVNLGLKVYL